MKTITDLLERWRVERQCDDYQHIINAGESLAQRLESLLTGRYKLEDG